MKQDKRAEARRLRQEQGLSVNQICKQLGVAKSSVSVWVRDIQLTEEQKAELERQHYAYRAQANGGQPTRENSAICADNIKKKAGQKHGSMTRCI